ncbi:unnamed protein product [Rotaria socialis]|uniref:Uncharacterized protein n=2 Tax=Rotaria socialis TaxID=392032 RepID=A0A820NQM3_9BILA|nr:unnamed protein product [Rotaria socialis]CAF4392339.1 unnamed protein product [Rotaria socialis]CAF4495486.1 unnamed protein product [Rotaria socialis]CAF4622026.1 unnamed protein product [Rotaria socialis]CAF4629701.1 unnamed protein product [Rotaria socialis]
MKESLVKIELFDNFKDLQSIGCIITEMIINTILFRLKNDDPPSQLLYKVQFVGGLTILLINHFSTYAKQLLVIRKILIVH